MYQVTKQAITYQYLCKVADIAYEVKSKHFEAREMEAADYSLTREHKIWK